jgi:hypothetical protein
MRLELTVLEARAILYAAATVAGSPVAVRGEALELSWTDSTRLDLHRAMRCLHDGLHFAGQSNQQ